MPAGFFIKTASGLCTDEQARSLAAELVRQRIAACGYDSKFKFF